MQIFYAICIYMLVSSLVMVAYVSVKNFKSRKSIAIEMAEEEQERFEETAPAAEEHVPAYPGYKQKIA